VLNTWPKERLTPLLDYLKAPDEGSCLILEAEGKLDKKRALYKALTHKSAPVVVVEEERLKGAALTRYAQREASALGLKIADDALALLQEASEEELNQVRDGLQKIKLYVGERVEVTREDVEALLPEAGLQAQIWDIADLVMERQQGRVLEVTRALLSALPSQSERARLTILLHTLLVKRVQGAMSAHALRKTGGDAAQLATLTGMHPYGAKKLMQSMSRSRFSPSELARALRLLLHADQALKGGKLPSELVLERLLIDVCML
jgi:DNA polymerase III subunit delta